MVVIPSERFTHLLQNFLFLLRSGQYWEIARKFKERVYDETILVGMNLDLLEFRNTRALPPDLTVRSVGPGEIPSILDPGEPGLSKAEIHDRVIRQQMLRSGIKTCYVAEDDEKNPWFIQWVITADQNDILERRFGWWYPRLARDEVLIEYAYTLPARRGAGIMPAVTSHLLERARGEGTQKAVTFIPAWNKRSIGIHLRMGFTPCSLFEEKRRFLGRSRRRTAVAEIPSND